MKESKIVNLIVYALCLMFIGVVCFGAVVFFFAGILSCL